MSSESEKPLTRAERRAIKKLKELAKTWPPTLWLFATGGGLNVMRFNAEGQPAMVNPEHGGVDPAFIVADICIPNDGGDW